jgi:gag-polypeptide of LTR copia-type
MCTPTLVATHSFTIDCQFSIDPSGSNWAIFHLNFKRAMIALCCWAHFDGTSTRPAPVDKAKLTEDKTKLMEDWDHEDFMACFLLSQRLPDTTNLKLSHCITAKESWDMLHEEYQAKSTYAKNHLEQTFLDMRCAKGGDVRAFLRGLQHKHEELAATGVTISDRDYRRTVLRGIPEDLARFASWLLTSHGDTPTSTDSLINDICEEADRSKNHRTRDQSGRGGGGKKEGQQDEALAATGTEGRRKKRRGKCHNCGKQGH